MAGENIRSGLKQRFRHIRARLGLGKRREGGRKESLKRGATSSSDYQEVFSSDISEVLAHWHQKPLADCGSPAKRSRRQNPATFPITNPNMLANSGPFVFGKSTPRVQKCVPKVLSGIVTSPGFKIYEDYEELQSGSQDSPISAPPPLPPRKPQYCLPPPLPRDRVGRSSVRRAHIVLRKEALLRNLEDKDTAEEQEVFKRETSGRKEKVVLRREAILRNLERNRQRRLQEMAHTKYRETPASA